jgi:predicted XRE-type DNA-binding protein
LLAQEDQEGGVMTLQIPHGVNVELGSGNVFADLGLPDADKLDLKSGLVIEIAKVVRLRCLAPHEAAHRLGITEEQLAALLRGEFAFLSDRRLMDCLNRLGYDIELVLRPSAEPIGCLRLA